MAITKNEFAHDRLVVAQKERFRVAHEVDAVVKRSKRKISERLCATRGWFFESRKVCSRAAICEDLVLLFVREERSVNPGYGTEKLSIALGPKFEKAGFSMGRDRLGDLLRKNGLLISQLKMKKFATKTTKQDPSTNRATMSTLLYQ